MITHNSSCVPGRCCSGFDLWIGTFRELLNQSLSRKEKSPFSFIKLHSKRIDVNVQQKTCEKFKIFCVDRTRHIASHQPEVKS